MTNKLMVINGNEITEKDVFYTVNNILVKLHDTDDLQVITNAINGLNQIDTVVGKAKAKLLWGASIWHKQNKPHDDFADEILSTTTIKNRKTVLEYVNVWKQIDEENIPKKTQDRPMRELVPIANMLAQGFSPSKKEWSDIDLCANLQDLGETISKIKGKKRRKTARQIVMERDGSINLWKDGKKKYLGFLDIVEAQEDKDIALAIEYIIADRITRK